VYQKYLESVEMWRWIGIEKMRWVDHVRNEEILHRVKEDRNIIHTIDSKGNWFGHILCRNCLLQHLKEGMIQGR
jgi:hypothetical protein